MIVRDEAQRLQTCLDSVRGIVDEIVIVDTGSQDDTVAIAQQGGARVYHFPWQDDFAAARNAALGYVQSDWVLVLDADEILTPLMQRALPQLCQQPEWLAVTLLRQEVGVVPPYTYVSRLFRRHPQIYFQRPYHETIDDSVLALQQRQPHWQIGQFNEVAILHYGYLGEQRQQKHERAKRIMRQYLQQQPQDAYLWSKLAGIYLAEQDFPHAAAAIEQGLNAGDRPASVTYELYYQQGNLYSAQQQWPEAIAAYEAAVSIPTPPLTHVAAYLRLAEAQKHLKQWQAALSTYDRLQELDPSLALAYQNQGALLLRLGYVQPALAKLKTAIQLLQEQNPPEALRLQQELEAMGLWVDTPHT